MTDTRKNHWETVYQTKTPQEVSWTQEVPKTSLELIKSFDLDKAARIIHVGGGDSNLVDFLLDAGFENITVLDISSKALEKAQTRLGQRASLVQWVVSDITQFKPESNFDVWHDRATFHFLTTDEQIAAYMKIVDTAVTGYLTIGTFSKNGPLKCSGLEIKQYDEVSLTQAISNDFEKIACVYEDHVTPFNTSQHFLFCSFKRKHP